MVKWLYIKELFKSFIRWSLDNHHNIIKNKIFPVGNTNMLYYSRFKEHFSFIGNFDTIWIFDGCGKSIPFENEYKCC